MRGYGIRTLPRARTGRQRAQIFPLISVSVSRADYVSVCPRSSPMLFISIRIQIHTFSDRNFVYYSYCILTSVGASGITPRNQSGTLAYSARIDLRDSVPRRADRKTDGRLPA